MLNPTRKLHMMTISSGPLMANSKQKMQAMATGPMCDFNEVQIPPGI